MDLHTSLAVFLFGLPGSGKGTQAQRLAEKFGFSVWDMGAILREERNRVLSDGKKIGDLIDHGILLTDEELFEVIKLRISSLNKDQRIIFDGVPRRAGQAEFLLAELRNRGFSNFAAVFIDISDEEAVQRLVLRGPKEHRKDDTAEAIQIRLRQADALMESLRAYLENHVPVYRIDGRPSVSEVGAAIEKALNL